MRTAYVHPTLIRKCGEQCMLRSKISAHIVTHGVNLMGGASRWALYSLAFYAFVLCLSSGSLTSDLTYI